MSATTSTQRRAISAALWSALIVLGVLLMALVGSGTRGSDQLLDPESTGLGGSKALAEVLRDHGVEVVTVRELQDFLQLELSRTDTVFLAAPGYLTPSTTREVADHASAAARLVIASPSQTTLDALGIDATVYPVQTPVSDEPRCDDPVTRRGERVGPVSSGFFNSSGSSCFPGQASDARRAATGLVRLPATAQEPETVLIGFAGGWTNRTIPDYANAALALRLLGDSPRLVWYLPGLSDLLAAPDAAANSAWPDLRPLLYVAGTGVLLLAFVRGRRLGPLVPEPLPVVVPEAESTYARSALYQRGRDRNRAAKGLRAAAAARLAARCGLPPQASLEALAVAVSARTGESGEAVLTLLRDTPIARDRDLVRLHHDLHHLEERTGRP